MRRTTEADVLRGIRLALGKMDDVCLWRNETGVAEHNGRHVEYGLCVGSADLIGIGPGGRFLAIEVKRPGKKPSAKQRRFLALAAKYGGISGWADSVDDAIAIVRGAR